MYRDGRGVKQDVEQAAGWYRKAAGQGDAQAQRQLGDMYRYGRGVKKDIREADRWYRMAAGQKAAAAWAPAAETEAETDSFDWSMIGNFALVGMILGLIVGLVTGISNAGVDGVPGVLGAMIGGVCVFGIIGALIGSAYMALRIWF